MKKKYYKPEMQVVTIKYQAPLLVGSGDPKNSQGAPDELNGSVDKYYYLD